MKIFAVFLLGALSSSSARPQNGYNYNAPNRGPGLDTSSFGSQSVNLENFVDGNNNVGRPNNFGPGFGNGFGVAQSNSGFLVNSGAGASNLNVQGGHFGGGNLNAGGFNGNGVSSVGFNQNSGGFASNIGGSGFGSNVGGGGFSGFQQRPTLVQKHIYVHVPPPDPEDDIIPQRQIQSALPQKHYKIIFIKAPSAPSHSHAQIQLAAQSQEKTIVYVLVKKPDDLSELAAPAAISAPSSKPEVYFIKYKTQKESRGNGLGGGASGLVSSLGGDLTATLGSSIGVTGSASGSSNVIGLGGGSSLGSLAPVQTSGSGSSLIGIGAAPVHQPSAEYGPPGYSRPF